MQRVNEVAARFGDGDFVAEQDCFGCDFAVVDAFVGLVVWAQGGTFEGSVGEKSAATGIAEEMPAPTRPQTTRPVTTGPVSWMMENTMAAGSMDLAPN